MDIQQISRRTEVQVLAVFGVLVLGGFYIYRKRFVDSTRWAKAVGGFGLPKPSTQEQPQQPAYPRAFFTLPAGSVCPKGYVTVQGITTNAPVTCILKSKYSSSIPTPVPTPPVPIPGLPPRM